jgi:hypothetical protein
MKYFNSMKQLILLIILTISVNSIWPQLPSPEVFKANMNELACHALVNKLFVIEAKFVYRFQKWEPADVRRTRLKNIR